MSDPSLTRSDVERPRGVVLMLHGGKPNGLTPVDARSASWQRSAAMMRAIAPALAEERLSVWLLRYRHRGWNAGAAGGPSPVADARWALDQVRSTCGDVPVVLLGHSMGARTAVAVADDSSVAGTVGLAPWLSGGDPVRTLRGKHLALAHGSADRITSARASRDYVERARRIAASVEFTDMGPLGHYMLRHAGSWNAYARSRSINLLTTATHSDA